MQFAFREQKRLQGKRTRQFGIVNFDATTGGGGGGYFRTTFTFPLFMHLSSNFQPMSTQRSPPSTHQNLHAHFSLLCISLLRCSTLPLLVLPALPFSTHVAKLRGHQQKRSIAGVPDAELEWKAPSVPVWIRRD